MNETAKKLLTVRETAQRLGISSALVYSLVAARRIRHERHGLKRGAIRISVEALNEYRQRCTVNVGQVEESNEDDQEEAVPVPAPGRKGPGIELW